MSRVLLSVLLSVSLVPIFQTDPTVIGVAGPVVLGTEPVTVRLKPPPSVSNVFQRCQASVVHIDTPEAQGSGVLFRAGNGSWWVWTVGHVVHSHFSQEPIRNVEVTFFNRQTVPGETIRLNVAEDIALIRLRDAPVGSFSVSWLTGPRPGVGERVIHAGCPLGHELEFSVTTGNIAYLGRLVDGQHYDQTTSPALPGSSGGGVFCQSTGACLGLVSLGWDSSFVCYVPEYRIRAFAVRTGVGFAVDPTGTVPDGLTFQEESSHARVRDEEGRHHTLPLLGGNHE